MYIRIVFLLFTFIFGQTIKASEIQLIENEEAYRVYVALPGVACQEYRNENIIVFTKYQTNSCSEEQTDPRKWNCTVHYEIKLGKIDRWLSAVCFREI